MSLSSALSNALSGLTASARGASVISSNLANVMTDGYAVRGLSLSSRAVGSDGGVMINGTTRLVDMALIGDRRLADAALAGSDTRSGYLARLSAMTGDPTDANSLTGLLAEFEAALISAASLPESETRLSMVLRSAQSVTDHLNELSDGIQVLRTQADRSIEHQVDRLNRALIQVEALNKDIISARSQSRDHAGLMDQRQAIVDEISAILPVKELQRDLGAIALMTPSGAVLLDGLAATLTFDSRNTVTSDMTFENGLLSGVSIEGAVLPRTLGQVITGGSLGGLLDVRDNLLTGAQSELDAFALDLIERFETGVDPTLSVGMPGLFSDGTAVVGPVGGVSARIKVNTLIDPNKGGDLWKLRAGLGAANQGEAGDAGVLQSMLDALSSVRPQGSDALGTAHRDAAGVASDFLSSLGLKENQEAQALSFAAAHQFELKEMELSHGVDSDSELQKLMQVEQAYAANARIIQAVDEMMQQLMEIGR